MYKKFIFLAKINGILYFINEKITVDSYIREFNRFCTRAT
jgi:hypothetical protein